MGNIIETLCRTCGFKNEFNLGGGKFSYRTNQPVPAVKKYELKARIFRQNQLPVEVQSSNDFSGLGGDL